jgi:hypothetical protein
MEVLWETTVFSPLEYREGNRVKINQPTIKLITPRKRKFVTQKENLFKNHTTQRKIRSNKKGNKKRGQAGHKWHDSLPLKVRSIWMNTPSRKLNF